jgi:hypothetical protein
MRGSSKLHVSDSVSSVKEKALMSGQAGAAVHIEELFLMTW